MSMTNRHILQTGNLHTLLHDGTFFANRKYLLFSVTLAQCNFMENIVKPHKKFIQSYLAQLSQSTDMYGHSEELVNMRRVEDITFP